MGSAGSTGAERTEAGGLGNFLEEVTVELGPKGCRRLGRGSAPGGGVRTGRGWEGGRSKQPHVTRQGSQGEAGEGLLARPWGEAESGQPRETQFMF